jgi:hypothetical protein
MLACHQRIMLFCFGALVVLLVPKVVRADTNPPVTYLNLSGTLSASGWYVSTVDTTLRASDLDSGPASTTYALDGGSPVVNRYASAGNAILNDSMEYGSYTAINNWTAVTGTPANMYQSYLPAKYGYRSAAISAVTGPYQYWTNVNSYVPVQAGKGYSASTWVKTFNMSGGPGSWFQVWAKDSSGNSANPDVELTESVKITIDTDWVLQTLAFTVPAGYNGIYLKLGSQADAGMTWYDGVTMSTGTDAITQFTIIPDGSHTLTYSSTDNAGNVEATNTRTPINIDTVDPQDWSFSYIQSGNAHAYNMFAKVRDITSGVNPGTAAYQIYDQSNCNCWSDKDGVVDQWSPVSSVTKVSDGSAAPIGYTGYVTLTTPNTDYGNNSTSTSPEVRFRINDVASSLGSSPIYALFGPWFQLSGSGDIYSKSDISITGTTPAGQYNADGIISSNGSIYNTSTSKSWYVAPYLPNVGDTQLITSYLPQYASLVAGASPLPGNRLPSSSGVYYYNGNYTIDSQSLTTNFQNLTFNAVVIINGNMTINSNFSLNGNAGVAFIVTGNIIYSASTSATEGLIVAGGSITTTASTTQLVHKGTWVGLSGVFLKRDLGKRSNPNTPAEQLLYQSRYLNNAGLARLLSGSTQGLTWQEQSYPQ